MQLSGRCSKCKSRNAVCTYDEPFVVRNSCPAITRQAYSLHDTSSVMTILIGTS